MPFIPPRSLCRLSAVIRLCFSLCCALSIICASVGAEASAAAPAKRASLPRVSTEQMIGQMIMSGFRATGEDDDPDRRAELDMNVAMNGQGKLIEIQGSAERSPFSVAELHALVDLAAGGIRQLVAAQRKALRARSL